MSLLFGNTHEKKVKGKSRQIEINVIFECTEQSVEKIIGKNRKKNMFKWMRERVRKILMSVKI